MSWDITLLVGGNAVLAATAAVLWRLWRTREAAVRRLSQEVRALLEDSSAELKVSEARYRSLNRFLPTGVVRHSVVIASSGWLLAAVRMRLLTA